MFAQGDASNVFQAQSRQRVARRLVEDRPIQSDGGSSRDTQHFVDLWSSGWRIDQISTTDEVSIAIGRICLAYTLDDAYWNAEEIDVVLNPGKREGDNDPGWSAFDSLKWMTRRMDAKETSEELRARICTHLSELLRRVPNGLLPAICDLVSSTFPQALFCLSFVRRLITAVEFPRSLNHCVPVQPTEPKRLQSH